MAFAPPRKTKNAESSRTASTRLPVSNLIKKNALADDTVVPRTAPVEAGTLKSSRAARIIPSRYLQDAASRGLSKSTVVERDTNHTSSRQQTSTSIHSPSKSAHGRTTSSVMNGPQKSVLASPIKKPQSQSHESIDDTVSREMLTLRIAHTMTTCDRGEDAFASQRRDAEARLEARWRAAKEVHIQQQLATRHERLQRDAAELEALRTEDVFILEDFFARVDGVCSKISQLACEIEQWAESASMQPPPNGQWKQSIASLSTQCDTVRLLVQPVIQRLEVLGINGVVKSTVDDFSAILSTSRLRLDLLPEYIERSWLKKKQCIDEEYGKLDLSMLSSSAGAAAAAAGGEDILDGLL